jgi:hypothetical protein
VVKFIEPSIPTSEDTDNEREESEQESSAPQVVETSSKVRKRHKNKPGPTTPTRSSDHIEGILINKDEKSPVTTRPQPMPHPKLAFITPKDEVELAKAKTQGKSTQASNKQPISPPPVPLKKSIPSPTNINQGGQKQQQQQIVQEQQEQPFTTVGGNRHKAATPPSQQQNKSVSITPSTTPVPAPSTPPQAPVQIQHEQLVQRQPPPRQQKETPTQLNGFNTNPLSVKQPPIPAASPTKLADLVKALPTSQAVVTELMSALDAFPLSTDELDIIMHKIANKQSVIKQDWSKLQHGQKVDPQAHIGQVLDESARAYEADMKTNAMKLIKELTDERSNDKHRINELMKETNEKDLNIQVLHAQLNSRQHPQQQIQSYQVEFKRLSEENMQLKQQQHFQQQQLSSLNFMNNNGDSTNIQVRVLSDQIKKLSVDNGNLEKQLKSKDLLIKEKEDLLRSNQQLIQKAQESQKQFQHNEEKLIKELNETRTLNINQLNDYKRHIEQLELEKEQLRRTEIVQVAPTLNNEEHEKLEQLIKENEQYKIKFEEIQTRYQSQENELRQQLKKISEQDAIRNYELADKSAQIETLRAELEEVKATNDSINSQLEQRLRQEQDKQKQFLVELLEQDVRNQLPNDNQDFNQWLSSYQQLFASSIESSKRALQDESIALKHENDQLLKNMADVESQLKEIEQTVQSKEELLLADLKNKDAILESIHNENDQLNSEVKRLQTEIYHLQSAHETAVNDNRALKFQLDEQQLVNTTSPSNITVATSDGNESTVSSSDQQS